MRTFTHADRVAMQDPVFSERYRRVSEHDGRYDGYFVVGMPMSETFCRPGCLTRTPRPTRVVFYPTAAAAHAAGLVPCPRCRPDATCASPQDAIADTVGTRAVRLIADGEVDRRGVGGVARRLGVTSRQVLRAVETVAGCGPLDLARARRAHLARQLLTATTIPVRDVAVAAGFATERQFHATMSQYYRQAPTELRSAGRRRASVPPDGGPLVLRSVLPVRQPFDATGIFRSLAAWAVPDVEQGGDHWYARTVRLPYGAGHLRVDRDRRGGLFAKLSVADPRDLAPLMARVRRFLGLDADPRAVAQHLRRDSALAASVADHPGIRLPGSIDHAETLLRMVIAQQVPAPSARTVLGGLANALGEATPWGLLFPTAAQIAEHGREVLRGTAEQINAVMTVARGLATGDIDVHPGSSRRELRETLAGYPGLGVGAAARATVLLLGDPDVFIAGDREVRRGAARLGLPDDPAALAQRAVLWSPWRSYAERYVRRAGG